MLDHLAQLERGLMSIHDWQARWAEFPTAASLQLPDGAIDEALGELGRRLRDNYPFHHPAYAGQMLKPPHPVAMMAYAMAMQINPNNHALDGGPATADLERECVAKIAQMFGFETHLGHLTSAGTTANLEALWVARKLHPDKAIGYSSQAHYTHPRMGEVIGATMVAIPVDGQGRLTVRAIEEAHRATPLGTVVVTPGTTGLGAIDPIHEIVDWARAHGVRVHVDAAYGGFYTLLAETEPPVIDPAPFRAIAGADSIVIDPHKHGLQPYGCGCVIFKDPSVGRLYKHDSPYTYFTSDELHLGEISLECSRAGAAAAALWATLRCFPLAPNHGLGPVLKACRRAAVAWAGLIDASPHLHLVTPPELDIVAFFPTGAGHKASAISQETEQIFQLLMNDPQEPVYLAKLVLPRELVAPRAPKVEWDQPTVTVLRSCLMKPEHEMVVPWLHSRVERYAGQPDDWGGAAVEAVVPAAPKPKMKSLTGPLSLKAEWQMLVERYFDKLREPLVAELKAIMARPYHPDVAIIDFEVSYPYGVGADLGVKLYTLGRDGWLVCAEDGEGFSGSQALLEPIREVIPADAMTPERFQALNDALEDTYEVTGKYLIDWFADCWLAAGGADCPLPAFVGFADDEESLDLKRQRWVEDAARQPV
jgi:glutamate/tyrosine decarboxylase-like PLP-dependent enzyme